ncbi:MAG: C39 family peptidase [Patescibacteria group bacterium]|nr:C39 family peptidase [Patescibacteria group bacterium]MDD4303881.1 C39 family peptidase [Patescibacteria group bacterium]MDD4695132.1 C39 family peptidase [Patescibacteria group bacterium]
MSKKIKILLIIFVLIFLGFIFYSNRIKIKELFFEKKVELPNEMSLNEINSSGADLGENSKNILNENVEMIHESSLRDDINTTNNNNEIVPNPRPQTKLEINLKIPFTIQSPDQKWDEDYKEGCEEASILMVYSFLENKDITVESAMKDIGDMISWQKESFGSQFDLSATTTIELAENFFNVSGEIIEFNSIEDMKDILSSGVPLILPTAGRELKNPNFKGVGPLYHMLVVKGFTKEGMMITNDPGTRKGKDYIYDENILWNAIADWDSGLKNLNVNKKIGIILK